MTTAETFTALSVIFGLVAVLAFGVAPFFIPLYIGVVIVWEGALAVLVSVVLYFIATRYPDVVVEEIDDIQG